MIGLTWQHRDPITGELGQAEQATRLSLQSEVVHFTSEDGTNLTGLLTLPATAGPYPAIMMLHGSEPGIKDNFGNQQMSAFMASQGIAILTYDKRGAGESEGTYVESASEGNLSLTAQDAIAGVQYLKSRPEINSEQIGLTGFSQAGWVIPLAASQSEDISYFIILSGPITSVGHEDIYSSYTNDGEGADYYSQEETQTGSPTRRTQVLIRHPLSRSWINPAYGFGVTRIKACHSSKVRAISKRSSLRVNPILLM